MILVARVGSTRAEELENAARVLRMVDAPLLGIVLNRVRRRKAQSYGTIGGTSSRAAERDRVTAEVSDRMLAGRAD